MSEWADPVGLSRTLRERVREALLSGEGPEALGPIAELRRQALASRDPEAAVLARRLDDLPRRVAFRWLAEVRGRPAQEAQAVARVSR